MPYAKITDYAPKDGLSTGNPAKIIKGVELGAEFDAIAAASLADFALKASNLNAVLTTPTLGVAASTNVVQGYSTTATAAGTTTLTAASRHAQYFTGTSTQTVVLPVTSTLSLGHSHRIVNDSTGAVTVQSSGANNVIVLRQDQECLLTCILLTGTTAASWAVAAIGAKGVPINRQSGSYTFTSSDAGGMVLHPSADTTARTFTIDSVANAGWKQGNAISVRNQNNAGVITISITADTLRQVGTGTTGSRTLAANGLATLIYEGLNEWSCGGVGVT